jgi:hypothetical protein
MYDLTIAIVSASTSTSRTVTPGNATFVGSFLGTPGGRIEFYNVGTGATTVLVGPSVRDFLNRADGLYSTLRFRLFSFSPQRSHRTGGLDVPKYRYLTHTCIVICIGALLLPLGVRSQQRHSYVPPEGFVLDKNTATDC